MKYLLSFCILSLFLFGCHQEKPAITKGKYFFDFNEVVYYNANMSEESFYSALKKQDKTDDEKLFCNMITHHNMPESIKDTLFLPKLEKIGFVKKDLPKSSNAALNEIFRQKECTDKSFAACIPFFRDVYIFKKNGKTVGVAKICYGCGISSFMGAKAPEDCFGKNSELEQLAKIVE